MWEYIQAGGIIMYPLILCSVISLTIILERGWFFLNLDMDKDSKSIEDIFAYAQSNPKIDVFNAEDQGIDFIRSKSLISRMLICGLAHRKYSCIKAMEDFATTEVYRMQRGLGVLDTIITVAPMLGILGTVTGIITSFDMLGQSGVEDPKGVVSGIAEALITTATGLAVSIASVFPYNFFRSLINSAKKSFESYGNRLEILLEDVNK